VIRAVQIWLREQETSWYREGMHALVSRRRKAVDVDGDYVKKSNV
jgi:23S rRNA maturation mini-RNase III